MTANKIHDYAAGLLTTVYIGVETNTSILNFKNPKEELYLYDLRSFSGVLQFCI